MPSIASSLRMRGAPQVTFAWDILRIRLTISRSNSGRPERCFRLLRVQKCRNPSRCQRITVAGHGMTEVAGFATYTAPGHDPETLARTVGRVAPEFELRVVGDKGGGCVVGRNRRGALAGTDGDAGILRRRRGYPGGRGPDRMVSDRRHGVPGRPRLPDARRPQEGDVHQWRLQRVPGGDKRGWSRWFSKIATRDDALRTIKDASNAFFILAGIQLVAALALQQYWNITDAAVLAILAFLLRRFASRLVAVALLVLALLEAGVTVANRLGVMAQGGRNLLLAAIVLWAAVRAVQATFKLHTLSEGGRTLIRS